MKNSLNNIILFFSFLITQVLLSNFVNFGPLVFIAVYPLFILTLPTNTSSLSMMLWSFAMGLGVDYFTDSIIGLNAAASVLLAFVQPLLFKLVCRKGELENQIRPGLTKLSLPRFLTFIVIGLVIHHLAITFLENFSLAFHFYSFIRIVLSLFINTVLILLIEFGIFYKNWR
ncbi:MAG: hypothetical protein ABFC28_01020 [Rikenellaceae bacterium]